MFIVLRENYYSLQSVMYFYSSGIYTALSILYQQIFCSLLIVLRERYEKTMLQCVLFMAAMRAGYHLVENVELQNGNTLREK